MKLRTTFVVNLAECFNVYLDFWRFSDVIRPGWICSCVWTHSNAFGCEGMRSNFAESFHSHLAGLAGRDMNTNYLKLRVLPTLQTYLSVTQIRVEEPGQAGRP